ncbi:MAG: nucleotidyltransferase family protein [Nitrospirae bacterium]|nr:nucleotidyltransferase family protein [Nitrospirota bacterium]
MMRINELSNEKKIVLLFSSYPFPATEALNIALNLFKDNHASFDYQKIYEIAALNGVAPLLYRNLQNFENLPQFFKDRLNNAYMHSLKNNVLNAEETLKLLDFLQKEKIQAIPLKGSIASEIIFNDSGIYPATDIDILIRPEDMEKSERIILRCGYEKIRFPEPKDLLSSHYHFIYKKENFFLELHWNLVKRYFVVPPDFWWQEIVTLNYSGIELKSLSPERYIIYTVFRLFDHCFSPLKFFVLVSGLISKYEKEIDWEKLLFYAGYYKMERLIVFTLKLLNELYSTPCAELILKKRNTGYDFLKREVIKNIFMENKKEHLKMILFSLLLDSPLDYARLIFERIFPKPSEIRLRYGLPMNSKKVYAYYLMNPFLVFTRKNPRH